MDTETLIPKPWTDARKYKVKLLRHYDILGYGMKTSKKHSEVICVVKTAAMRVAPEGQTIDLLIPQMETPSQQMTPALSVLDL